MQLSETFFKMKNWVEKEGQRKVFGRQRQIATNLRDALSLPEKNQQK